MFVTSRDFMKNKNPLKDTFGFVKVAGGLAVIYISMRLLARLLLGRRRRDNILRELHLENLTTFLNLFHLPNVLAESFMVKKVETQIGGKHFQDEPAVCSLLLNKHGCSFIDIGASIGYYSFLLYNNFDRVLAIEPHPRNFKVMQTVKARHDYNKIRMLQIAVSDRDGETKLYLGSDYGKHSLLNGFPYIDKLNFIKVRTATLNSLLKKGVRVDLIKVDVEGAEWKVLNGAKKVMDNIKSWLIELHDLTRRKQLEDLMKSYGYNVMWVDLNHMYAWRNPNE